MAKPETPPATEEANEKGSIVVDQELKALNAIIKSINALQPDAQRRIMSYLNGRYLPALVPMKAD